VGAVRVSVRIFDIAFYQASDSSRYCTQEQFEESDAWQYAPYRRWMHPMDEENP
jgi:hypothetical protein